MRFMIPVKATAESEAGDFSGSTEMFEKMGKFNEELVKAAALALNNRERAMLLERAATVNR